ncbi:MAG: SLBB domain-containing protein [Candidatus Ozemobacteraceae bacterium]
MSPPSNDVPAGDIFGNPTTKPVADQTEMPIADQAKKTSGDQTEKTVTDQAEKPVGKELLNKDDLGDELRSGAEARTAGGDGFGSMPLFGYDVFQRVGGKFATPSKGPVGPDYIVGPGDAFQIRIWGREETALDAEINVDGDFILPRFGRLPVSGMTFDEMKKALNQAISRQVSEFQMSVVPIRQRRCRIFVLGEVQSPGSFDLEGNVTAYGGLFAAGGPTIQGSLRAIQVKRGNKDLVSVDLYDFLLSGNRSSDVPLQDGDVLFVPLAGTRVGIRGGVRRPAMFELLPTEQTLGRVLEYAGGIAPTADLRHVQIHRVVANARRVVFETDLGVKDGDPRKLKTPVIDLDTISVFSISPRLLEQVTLVGHVFQPGPRPWHAGIKLSEILDRYEMLQKDPYLEYGEILREVAPDGRNITVRFNPGQILSGDLTGDLDLQPNDRIRIFAAAEMQEGANVFIDGEVLRPGKFPLIPGMTVKDLIFQAGGLKIGASPDRAEFTRRMVVNGKKTSTRTEINLDKALADHKEDNILLQPFDELIVRSVPEWRDRNVVTLSGEFVYPGRYSFEPGDRLSSVIQRAGGFRKKAYQTDPLLQEYGEIQRATGPGGTPVTMRFHPPKVLSHDPEADLILHPNDQIKITASGKMEEQTQVVISGEVQHPGAFPFTRGMTLRDLLIQAGGLKISASHNRAEFTRRLVKDGKKSFTRSEIDLDQVMNDKGKANFPLQSFDDLVVRPVPEWSQRNEVILTGEFVYPGKYSFEPGEKLNSVIKRAGGFLPKAYLPGAVMRRMSTLQSQQENVNRLMKETNLQTQIKALRMAAAEKIDEGSEAANAQTGSAQVLQQQLLKQLESIQPLGRVVIHLSSDPDFAESKDDPLLETGDQIHVPQKPSLVLLEGAVRNPTGILWEPKKNIRDYITQAGGLQKYADKGNVYLIRADGSALHRDRRPANCFLATFVEPGDTIWVPNDLRPLPASRLKTTQVMTQIMSNLALTIIAIDRIPK